MAAAFAASTPRPSPATSVQILNPDSTDRAVLARLSVVRVHVKGRGPSWVGPYTVCTRIALGWSDCLPMSPGADEAMGVDAYFDPKSPLLEIWLLDEHADLARPLRRLTVVRLQDLAADAGVDLTGGGLTLTAHLHPRASSRQVIASPTAAEQSIVRLTLTN